LTPRSSDLPYKDPEVRKLKQRQYSKRWYESHAAKHKAGASKNKRIKRNEWIAFKETQACLICGFAHPAVIDFHHVIRDKTARKVNRLIANGSFKQAIEEATTKCVPLCSRCHRLVHWYEQEEAREQRRVAPKKARKRVKK
jgi:hypothetical protein